MSSPHARSSAAESSAADAPAAPLRIAVVAVVALGLGIGAARCIESTGKQPVAAYLQVRTTFVTADRPCRVLEQQQEIGERITIGDPLIAYSDTELEQKTESARQKLEMLTKELQQAEARARLELAQCEQEIDDRICQVQLQAADFRHSQHESEMRRSLLADLLASHQTALWDTGESMVKTLLLNQPWPNSERMQTVLQMETYANQADLLAANIEICESRLTSLKGLKTSLPEQIRESCGVSLTALRLEQTRQELERLEARQTELVVTSPAVGQVGVFRSRPGDVLQPGDPIVELLDDSQRYLIAEVPSTRIHEFKPGRTVVLHFPGNERRQGRVSKVAPQAAPRDPSQPGADPLVAVDLEQAGRLWPSVPIGTRIDVIVDPSAR